MKLTFILAWLLIGALVIGYLSIRKGNVKAHQALMQIGGWGAVALVLFVVFDAHALMKISGSTFAGQKWVLYLHEVTASAAVLGLLYMLITGQKQLRSPRLSHKRIGLITIYTLAVAIVTIPNNPLEKMMR